MVLELKFSLLLFSIFNWSEEKLWIYFIINEIRINAFRRNYRKLKMFKTTSRKTTSTILADIDESKNSLFAKHFWNYDDDVQNYCIVFDFCCALYNEKKCIVLLQKRKHMDLSILFHSLFLLNHILFCYACHCSIRNDLVSLSKGQN